MCRGKTCIEWFEVGSFTCSELRAVHCSCDSCCAADPPPPPSPPSPPPSPSWPPPLPPPFGEPQPPVGLIVGGVSVSLGGVALLLLLRKRLRKKVVVRGVFLGGRTNELHPSGSDVELFQYPNGSGSPEEPPRRASITDVLGSRARSLSSRADGRYKGITPKKRRGALALEDGDHSLLHALTLAWRAALKGGGGEGGGEGGDEDGELMVEQLLEGFVCTLRVAEVFGAVMQLAVKNDEANFSKVRKAWGALGTPDPQQVASLRGLLTSERASGIHRTRPTVLADPSAAMALMWMRRTLTFQNAIMERFVKERSVALAVIAKDAYKVHLEQFHSFILKNTFRVGLNGMPKREEFLERLAPNLQGSERDSVCYSEMSDCVEVQSIVIKKMLALFTELDLEDLRKA